jgi:hypothetical protein
MAVICPAVLAETAERYHQQMEKVAGFAERLQIDLTDGVFTTGPLSRKTPGGRSELKPTSI